jgi:hypothetical protein
VVRMKVKVELSGWQSLVAGIGLSAALATAIAATLALAQERNTTAPVAKQRSAPVGATPVRHKLQITPQCQISPAVVHVYADFEMKLDRSETPPELQKNLKQAAREGRGRYLWNIECSRSTKACRGFHMDLTPSDHDEPIKSSDVATMQGASIRTMTDSLVVIEWGAYSLSIDRDLDHDAVTLLFGSNGFTGKGVGRCGKAMWIGF